LGIGEDLFGNKDDDEIKWRSWIKKDNHVSF
jgi:hypothetical protein